jgi:hypothetical protein
MAKKRTLTASSSAPAPVSPYRWLLPVGISILTDRPVSTDKRPSKHDIETVMFEVTSAVIGPLMEGIRKALPAGYTLVDDAFTEDVFPASPNGTRATIHYAPVAPAPVAPKVTAVSTPVANDAPGPLATPATEPAKKRGKKTDVAPAPVVETKPAKPAKKNGSKKRAA